MPLCAWVCVLSPYMSDEDPNNVFSISNYCFLYDLTGFITVHTVCALVACCWQVCDLTHFPSHSNIRGWKDMLFNFQKLCLYPSALLKNRLSATHPHMWQPNFKVKFTSLQEANKQEPWEANTIYEYKADFLFIYRFILFQILHIHFSPPGVKKSG